MARADAGADRQCRLRASFLEVHNEDVWDLHGEDDRPLDLLEGARGAVTVVGLREAHVANGSELLSLLQVMQTIAKRQMAAVYVTGRSMDAPATSLNLLHTAYGMRTSVRWPPLPVLLAV